MLEILGHVLPLIALEPRLHRHCLLFVDNEPVKHALMKGYGKDECVNRLVQAAWVFIEKARLHPEWQRVSSSGSVSSAAPMCLTPSVGETLTWRRAWVGSASASTGSRRCSGYWMNACEVR